MHNPLVLPMIFYVFYICALAVFNLSTRIAAIKSKKMSAKYFKTYTGENPPERVTIVSRHFENQFQVPLLFFAGCCAHMALGLANETTIWLAWAFVATRLFHSMVHLGSNRIPYRLAAYAAGWLVLLFFWGQLGVLAFAR